MSVRIQHTDQLDWFITFTCHNWLHLFEVTQSYDLVYQWFDYIRENKKAEVMAFVIMPNHLHAIIRLCDFNIDLNKLVSNAKRFMAYELIIRLKAQEQMRILQQLEAGVTPVERRKGQLHKAFEPSFDAKSLNTIEFFNQKLNYIHYNPVKGKWNLAEHYTDYEHSSASFYETGLVKQYKPLDYRTVWF